MLQIVYRIYLIFVLLLLFMTTILTTTNDKITTLEATRTNLSCIDNLCNESPVNYPIDAIINALQQSNYKSWPLETFDTNKIYFDNTENGGDSGEALCLSRRIRITPKWGRNIDNIERFIVNVDTNRQQFFIEQCRESKCIDLITKPGYQSVCIQKYIEAAMLVYVDEKIVVEKFRIPSCCVCLLKKNA